MSATAGDALMADIIANPGDDSLRLILADWLADNGRPEHGEFVRVQCELARLLAPKTGLISCEGKGPPARAGSRSGCKCRPCSLLFRESELWGMQVQAPDRKWVLFDDLNACVSRGVAAYVPQDTAAMTASGHISRVIVRRGWPAEARMALAQWMGERCRCDDGTVYAGQSGYPCRYCNGNGHTGGVGPLLARYPIERLEITGESPLKVEGVEDYRWARHLGSTPWATWELPPAIFDHLLPDRRCVLVRDGVLTAVRAYESEADALAGLATACLRWARRKP